MDNFSFWEKQTFFKPADFTIIGSGIVGLNAAIRLKELSPQSRVIIVERGILPTGASTRNAGFACFGSITELLDDLKNHSEDEVFGLVEKRWNGLQKLRARIGDTNLAYLELGGFELFNESENAVFENCLNYIDYFNKNLKTIIGKENVYQNQSSIIANFGFSGIKNLIWNSAEGQIDTGKMMHTLLKVAREKEIEILNGIEIKNFENHSNYVEIIGENNFRLESKKVIIATNGFTKRLFPNLEIQPARNQVLITQPIDNLSVKGTFHYDRGYVYFRNIGDRILLGGFRNLATDIETTDEFGTTKLIKNALEDFLKNTILPNQEVEIDSWWSGILGVGNTKKPIVKTIENNIFAAVRLGGMGVAIGTLVGEEVAELVIQS